MYRAVAGAVVALVAIAAPATAESGMRYWAYWDGTTGVWQYATEGAGTRLLTDGSVEGWSFVVSSPQGEGAKSPRDEPLFDDVCGETPAEGSKIRVALIVDPGDSTIAPQGETPTEPQATCVVLEANASGFDALSAVHDVRAEGGFLCGLDGYPQTECAPVVDLDDFMTTAAADVETTAAQEADSASESTSTSPLPTLITIAVIALLGAVIVIIRKRRRS